MSTPERENSASDRHGEIVALNVKGSGKVLCYLMLGYLIT
jgi:hypothetical protein